MFEKKYGFLTSVNGFVPHVNPMLYYKNNSIVNACIERIVRCGIHTVSNAPYKNLVKKIIFHLYINGNIFVHLLKNEILDSSQIIDKESYYLYKNEQIQKNDVKHLKIHNGMSPILTAQKAIEIYDNISKYILGVIKNGGKPSGIISLSQQFSWKDKNNFQEEMQSLINKINEGSIVTVEGGNFKWEPIGLCPNLLNLEFYSDRSMREICCILGVPPSLIMKSTYTNYTEARKDFWLETLVPLMTYIQSKLTIDLKLNLKEEYFTL